MVTVTSPPIQAELAQDGKRLVLRFPYDPQLVMLTKTVPGRRYNPDFRFWTIPLFGFRDLESATGRAGVQIVLGERARRALDLGRQAKRDLLAAKAEEDSDLEVPTPTELRPYQRAGISFLLKALKSFKGVLLCDEMGLGKTIQSLAVIALSLELKNVLVLCPASVKFTWEQEIKKHFPGMSYVVIDGAPEERKAQWASRSTIKIANYELLLRDKVAQVKQWDLVIADEIVKAKNYQTKTAKAIKKLTRMYSVGLSGAPVENRLEELHSVMDFCVPGLLGPGWRFVQEHCVRNRFNAVVGYRGKEKIRTRIAPHYLRRLKSQVLTELPPKIYNEMALELNSAEWEIYEAIRQQIKAYVEENPKLSVVNVLTEMLRLKQCTDDLRLLGEEPSQESSKLTALRDILEASEGHKVVAYTQFAQLANMWHEELGGLVLFGGVPAAERQRRIERFQSGPEQLFLSTEAGAYGITLTAADIVVHIDQPWNPARLRQREDRLHRIGQRECVQVVTLTARRTIDEYIGKVLDRKRELTSSLFEDEDVEALQLTKQELLAMLEAS